MEVTYLLVISSSFAQVDDHKAGRIVWEAQMGTNHEETIFFSAVHLGCLGFLVLSTQVNWYNL